MLLPADQSLTVNLKLTCNPEHPQKVRIPFLLVIRLEKMPRCYTEKPFLNKTASK